MPTINQLIRKSRRDKVRKSKSPHLGIGYNALKKEHTQVNSHSKKRSLYTCNDYDSKETKLSDS